MSWTNKVIKSNDANNNYYTGISLQPAASHYSFSFFKNLFNNQFPEPGDLIEVSMHHTEHFVHTDLILFVKIKWCSDVTTVIDRLFKKIFFFPFSRMLWLSCALQYFRVGWCNSVFKKSHVVLICSTKYDSLPILGVSHQKLGIVEFKFAKAIWFQSWVTISIYIW